MVKNFLKILICPLDWGMGHATRCVPVIRHLTGQNHEVIIAADGTSLKFLKEYFPGLKFIKFPGARITYSSGKNMMLKMMLQSPSLLINIFKEHQHLKRIIREVNPDVVISDNRFGLWSKQSYSIYMTHQVMIKAPRKWKWAEPFLYRIHNWFIRHYDECWIPDLPGEINLSGDLSHKYPVPGNASFAGILSRFENDQRPTTNDQRLPPSSPDLLVLLSGPEPQRSIFENIIMEEIKLHRGLHIVILQGLPGERKEDFPVPGVAVFNHLPDKEITRLVINARTIICRPGYSTLMDLVTLERNAVLVPTPGQTEQEYLAESLSASGLFAAIDQKEFDLTRALQAGRRLPVTINFSNDQSLLEKKISSLAEILSARPHQ